MLLEGTPQWTELFNLHDRRLAAAAPQGWEALREAWLMVPGQLRPALTNKLWELKAQATAADRKAGLLT